VVASGTAKAAGAAEVRVPLSLRVKPRKARGGKLVLRVRWTGAAGGAATATARVSVR
jgi:hypothetical protein